MTIKSGFLKSLVFAVLVVFSCEQPDIRPEVADINHSHGWFDELYANTLEFPAVKSSHSVQRLLSPDELNELVMQKMKNGKLNWLNYDTYLLWNAVREGGGYVTIGVKPIDRYFSDDENLSIEELNKAKTYTVEFIRREVAKKHNATDFNIHQFAPENIEQLPFIALKIEDFDILDQLKGLPSVRYVEPFYDPALTTVSDDINARTASSGGCGNITSSMYSTPFSSRGYNSKVSWHLDAHRVTSAWAHSTGRNVHIGMIDTGIDSDQDLMKSPKFNSGLSSGRTITKHNLTGSLMGWGHGTGVAGVIAAPVNNNGGMTGVAYQASLTSYRVNDLPALLSNQAVNDFNTALTRLANDTSIKIINISLGKLKHKSSMEDAINYAYNRGKLIFCSTGYLTGEDGGVYPAKFDRPMAVTGVLMDPLDPQGVSLKVAGSNPIGSYVEFAVYLQRATDDACVLTMDNKNHAPNSGRGSSQGAATMSGIAALVWSANPYLTRDEVVTVLRDAASIYRYQRRKDSNYGWGVVDALKAVQDAIAIGTQCRDIVAFNTNISGAGSLCVNSTSVYTILNLPTNVTVASWSQSSNLQLTSSSANARSYRGIAQGAGWIKATLSSGCEVIRHIQVGPYAAAQLGFTGTSGVCAGNWYTYKITLPEGHSGNYSYEWRYPSGWILHSQGNGMAVISPPSSGASGGIIQGRVNNGCGFSEWRGITVYSYPCNGPNPM